MLFDTDFKRCAPAEDVEIKIRKDTSYDSKARIHLVLVQIKEDMPFETDFKRRHAPADDVEIKIRKDTSYDS